MSQPCVDPAHVRVRARLVWTPDGAREDHTVELDERGVLRALRPGRAGDGPRFDGLLVPGLINAHTHLELSHLAGAVPPGGGFVGWARRLIGSASEADPVAAGREAVRAMQLAGTAWVWDVSNGGHTAGWLQAAALDGVVLHELLGFDPERVRSLVAVAELGARQEAGRWVRPTPHAVFSTAPALIVAAVGASSLPCSIHLGESADEAAFVREGTGPFAELLDRLGRDWRWWTPPGGSAVAYLDALGVLGPRLVLVHGVWLGAEELARVGARGAAVCLCARSNLHVEGRLPDVPAMIAAGVPLCLGTDSLASCPDLDVLGEIPVLARAFPDVPAARWLAACTHGAAGVLGLAGRGALVEGAAPGLVGLLGVREVEALGVEAPRERVWWSPPGGALCSPC